MTKPRDAKGKELAVGDEVLVRFKVTGMINRDKFCNVTLEALGAPDGEHVPEVNCNSGFCHKHTPATKR